MKKLKHGFTLVEITLVMVIILILVSITTPLLSNTIVKSDLNSAHESLYNALLRAQQLSEINYKNQQWRVCIDNISKMYTITAGTCNSTIYPETIKFSSGIDISSNQTLDILFTPIKGELSYSGSFIIITLSGNGVSKSIKINKSGIIDKSSTLN